MKLIHFKKFSTDKRSSFAYWYYHWKAFNLLALKLHHWRPHYLLHDIEKPFLKLFLPYNTVQKWHRKLNAHHLQYWLAPHCDWYAMVIDWECGRFTKLNAPLTAREECARKINNNSTYSQLLLKYFYPICDKLGI